MEFGNIPEDVLQIPIESRYPELYPDSDSTLEQALRRVGEDIIQADWSITSCGERFIEFTAWTETWLIWYDKKADYLRCFAREPFKKD